ncbi:hypothetical protein Sme01_01790 [Sphaerisporangium melleum]|uniref:Uncharacterized protein n=1 Tax=Sphaerisporangium melleum TaxID=321316 RepID=A0A917R3Q2_9ACTN|nr:hypothetical protein GCM10007964_34120 [Sphaerisporangium melleum]GII67703.1 hypothetical protein Sme01_01790 [Sphaerisporangium melleum]
MGRHQQRAERRPIQGYIYRPKTPCTPSIPAITANLAYLAGAEPGRPVAQGRLQPAEHRARLAVPG